MNYNIPSVMANPTYGMPSIPAVGYRFHPTNEELINNYLKPKLLGDDVEDLLIIAEVNVCEHEPWDLPVKSKIESDDPVWHFFCRRDFKYSNSRRSNRRTKAGFWKPTGKNVKIKAKRTKKVIGTKKTLVFYISASPKPVRTEWIMHEYEFISDSSLSNPGEYVLCKLKKNLDEKTIKGVPKDHMASISGFEAEPSCSMASDFENQNHSELTAYSACVESESSHHLVSDFENQNSNELMTNLAQEVCESSHFTATDFDNQNSNELMSNSAYDGSGSHHSMASNFGNQNSNELMSSSAHDGCGSCHAMSSDFENQNKNELMSNLANDGSGLLHSLASNYKIQYPNELIVNIAYNGSEQSHRMAYDSENQDPMEMTSLSPFENWFMASDFEDPVSSLQPEGETGPSVEMPSKFINHSTYGKGGRNSLLASDFEYQNLDKVTDISAPDEGERSSLTVMPSDLENQNPWEKTDMSTLEVSTLEDSWLRCLAASPENSPTDASFLEFPKLSPKLLAELKAELEAFLELEDSLNPLPQPPASTSTEEVPTYTGIGASVST